MPCESLRDADTAGAAIPAPKTGRSPRPRVGRRGEITLPRLQNLRDFGNPPAIWALVRRKRPPTRLATPAIREPIADRLPAIPIPSGPPIEAWRPPTRR